MASTGAKRNVDPTIRRTRSAVANASHNGATAPDDLRQDHAEAVIAAAIRRTVEKAPPLRPEQRERLVGLLLTAGRVDMTPRLAADG